MPHEELTQVPFDQVFRREVNGNLILQKRLRIGDEVFETETPVAPGQLLNGVDFHKRQGLDMAFVITAGGTHILRGFYYIEDE